MEIVVIIILTAALVFLANRFLGISSVIYDYIDGQIQLTKPLEPAYRKILKKGFPYYANLGKVKRRDFERRLKYFLHNKEFIGRNMKEVTQEMKLMIGACAVQLTFGFRPLRLAHFNKIILYPKEYISRHSGRKHKGEINTGGLIVLSWEDFLKGYRTGNDGYNLGLHEMAHALKFEDAVRNEEYAFLDEEDLQNWNRISSKEFYKVKSGNNSFLRSYAGTNRDEFFAVCVEQFFEQPEDFKRSLPDLYQALSHLLNQDPILMKAKTKTTTNNQ
jgi:MtfA peptidase